MRQPARRSRANRRRQREASTDSNEVDLPQLDGLSLVDNDMHSVRRPVRRPTAAEIAAHEAAKVRASLRPRLASELFVSQRGEVTQAEIDSALCRARAFQATLTEISTSILFVMDETAVYRTFYLDFGPTGDFVWQYMPLKAKRVKMVDENYVAWTCGWNPGEERITGPGWYHLALQNCLEAHDAVVLEILHDTYRFMEIQVHAFRVAPILRGCTGWKRHICPPLCRSAELDPTLPIEPIRPRGPLTVASLASPRASATISVGQEYCGGCQLDAASVFYRV